MSDMSYMTIKRLILLSSVLVFAVAGCSLLPPGVSTNPPAATSNSPAHVRKMQTPQYTGNRGAVIFSLNHVGDKRLAVTVDQIIRLFAENGVPLDIAVQPDDITKCQDLMSSLLVYEDAGIVDISISGEDINWLDIDSANIQSASAELKSQLSIARERVNGYFGAEATACVFPYEALNEYNYKALQAAGFKILSTRNVEDFIPSRRPVNWRANADPGGLYRLPITSSVTNAPNPQNEDTFILDAVNNSLDSMGIAVIEIDPTYSLGDDGASMVQQLSSLIKSVKGHIEIVTFDGWGRYAGKYLVQSSSKRVLPPYDGGTAVIFRLDDVSKGWHEDVDEEIIKVFKSNGVPLDCGVVSNVNGTDSYQMPWLKKYVDDGDVGISVHGYDWTYYQLDTTKSGLTYDFIKYKLIKAQEQYLQYFSVFPVAVTVPTDYYDETGYKAVQAAGFKVFATQIFNDTHASNQPVDYSGRADTHGLYRIPTASDVSNWNTANNKFEGIIDISKLAARPDACKNYETYPSNDPSGSFGYSLCYVLGKINVAAIGIHPNAFVDKDGKPDLEKIQKLDPVIKWVKTFATVTTYEQWYNFQGKSR